MQSKIHTMNYCTKEKIVQEEKINKTRTDFQKYEKGVYDAAKRLGIFDNI